MEEPMSDKNPTWEPHDIKMDNRDYYQEYMEAGVMPGNLENKSVFDTVKILIEKGLTFDEAIVEIEKKLRVPLPIDIKDRIRGEIK